MNHEIPPENLKFTLAQLKELERIDKLRELVTSLIKIM